jgi:hypothetical protein
VALVRERTRPTQRAPDVGEVSANFLRIEGCRMVSATDPYGRNLSFLDGSGYFFFQVAPQFHSRDWTDPIPDPLLLRKSGSTRNRTRTSVYNYHNSGYYPSSSLLKLVVCILLRVLGQVQGFRLTLFYWMQENCRLFRQCGVLNISQPSRPPPVMGIKVLHDITFMHCF